MLTINNKEYRNLVEQVLKNKEDIAKHYDADRVLEDYGIKVVGQVDFVEQLPSAALYTGAYGDAYLVGVSAPYVFYIFTRPFVGETENQWFNLGELAIQGPEGPQGPVGPQGPRGENTRWYIGQSDPYGQGYNDGDCYLNSKTGVVFIFENNVWTSQGSIKGATGAQGPKGDKGDKGDPGEQGIQGEAGVPGDAVRIVGILSSTDMLPDPTTVDRDTAYVIQETSGNFLYFITGLGTEDNPLIWNRVPFENGTTVLVGGEPVETFNADSKVSKTASVARLYGTGWQGEQVAMQYTGNPDAYTIAYRDAKGRTCVASPTDDRHATPKKYVDDTVAAMGDTKMNAVANNSNSFMIPVIPFGSNQPVVRILATAVSDIYSGRIPYYFGSTSDHPVPSGGWLITATPNYEGDCTNKKYVDDLVKSKTEGQIVALAAGQSAGISFPSEYLTANYVQIEINAYGGDKATTGVSFTEGGSLYNYIKILVAQSAILIIAQDLDGNGYVAQTTTAPRFYAQAPTFLTYTYTKLMPPTTT